MQNPPENLLVTLQGPVYNLTKKTPWQVFSVNLSSSSSSFCIEHLRKFASENIGLSFSYNRYVLFFVEPKDYLFECIYYENIDFDSSFIQ